jgi:hypothetical protein
MIRKALAATVMLAWLSAPAPSSALTGADLYANCQSKGQMDEMACVAYIGGFSEGLLLGTTLGSGSYCPPKGLGSQQTRLIVEKFLRDHPERLHEHAAFLAAHALTTAFKCKP